MEGGIYNKKLFFYIINHRFILQKIIFHIKLGTYNQWFWTTLLNIADCTIIQVEATTNYIEKKDIESFSIIKV